MELNEYVDRLADALLKDLERRQGKKLFMEGIGKVEADKIVRARAESVERLAGKKLFTEEQLAEVAQEIKKDPPLFQELPVSSYELVSLPTALYEFVAQAFAGTIEKMTEPETLADATRSLLNAVNAYNAVSAAADKPAKSDDGPTIKFRRYPSLTSEFVPPPSHKNIIEAIRTMQHAAWENSKAHGWNEAVDNPASALMMITREVSELAEEERDASSGESTKIPGFSKKEEEAADIAIRLLSYCGARNMRLGAAICAKHEFNKTRPYRHGNKLF